MTTSRTPASSVAGGGWISGPGHGLRSQGVVKICSGEVTIPPARDLFEKRLPRYGRFDTYTRLGLAAVALCLQDAGVATGEESQNIGLVCESRTDCAETDHACNETTLEQGGALTSPNLFSYTLPGIVLGECAVHFGLTGPTLSVTQQDTQHLGLLALRTAMDMIAAGQADRMLAGWIESAGRHVPEDAPCGAVFVLLEAGQDLCIQEEGLWLRDKPVASIIDLF